MRKLNQLRNKKRNRLHRSSGWGSGGTFFCFQYSGEPRLHPILLYKFPLTRTMSWSLAISNSACNSLRVFLCYSCCVFLELACITQRSLQKKEGKFDHQKTKSASSGCTQTRAYSDEAQRAEAAAPSGAVRIHTGFCRGF